MKKHENVLEESQVLQKLECLASCIFVTIELVSQRNTACISGFQVMETFTLCKIGLFHRNEETSLCLVREQFMCEGVSCKMLPVRIEFEF
jgi:hypothetical protein